MSRLYIILLTLSFSPAFGQDLLGKYLKFAEEQYEKGDYYYAQEFYQKALELDSNSVDILWKYAETLRSYKDYRLAEYYYKKVYEKDLGAFYPNGLLYLGIMQKHNGKYDDALDTFKKAKKKYYKEKTSYAYLKAKREVESCLWAISAQKDAKELEFKRLPETVNTKNSEFGHIIYDKQLIFSSLRADSISTNEEVYEKNYTTQIYASKLNAGSFEAADKLSSLLTAEFNAGNGTFSLDGNRFYFSRCSEEGHNYRCKIMVANYSNGKWSSIDELGEIINVMNKNTTMPQIAEFDGKETLFFCSDREGTEGGLDVWYVTITNGNQFGKVKALKSINSIENELSPWYDSKQKRLYFSSSWHDGFGGADVLYSDYNGQFSDPVNAGLPVNSPANDLYYFSHNDTSYVTSNRLGVIFSKNPTCCSDIFAMNAPSKFIPPTPKETLVELNKRLPVTLYFHNDVPDPRSTDTLTSLSYMSTYNEYTAMIDKYKKEYAEGLNDSKAEEAKEDIESFFVEYVDQGAKDLALFRDLLLEELKKGTRVKITIQGYASPLAKTDYNVNLTKRRISSLVNHLKEFQNGVFIPYLNGTAPNGGYVVVQQIPFGEYSANQLTSDNPNDTKNSVYSRSAAIERKIEIQSVSYLDTQNVFPLSTINPVFNAGQLKSGTTIFTEFSVKNDSQDTLELAELEVPCDCLKASIDKNKLLPGESATVKYEFNTTGYIGHTVKSVYLPVTGQTEKLRLIITTELQ